MDVPARCVAVYIVNKISDVFTAILQAVGGKTGKDYQGFGKSGF